MALARKALLAAATVMASGGLMLTSASAAPADTMAETSTDGDVSAEAVTWKHVWRTASSFTNGYWPTGGKLFAGNNYFYCQQTGPTYNLGSYHNNWWLRTDDDSGNRNVLVNAVFISGGNNFEPIAGVPRC